MGERIKTSLGQTGIIEWTSDDPWKARFIPDGGAPIDMSIKSMQRGTTAEAIKMNRSATYTPPEESRKRWMTYELTSGDYFTYEWTDRPAEATTAPPRRKGRAQRDAEQRAMYAASRPPGGERP